MDKTLVFEDPALAKGFTQIPNAILRCSTLSVGSRLLYAILLSYAWQDGQCFPGQERLANDLGFKSVQGIRKLLTELKKAGLIQVVRRGHMRTNVYVITSWSKLELLLSDRNCSSGQAEVMETVVSITTGDGNYSFHQAEVMETVVSITTGDGNCSFHHDGNCSFSNEYTDDKQADHAKPRPSLSAAAGFSDDQKAAYQSLVDLGVGRRVAARLVREFGPKAAQGWVSESKCRPGLRNPAGWVRDRVESGELPPQPRRDRDDPDRYISGEYAEFVER
jgi:hypothetical protein